MLENMRRLHPRGAASRGICVDGDGAMLGPACVLVGRTGASFRGIGPDSAAVLQKSVLDADRDQDWLFRQSQRIADALNQGEVALAQIYGLYIPIGELDDRQLRRLASVGFAKAFDPDEPRIPAGSPHGGEWTTGGGEGGAASQDAASSGDGGDGGEATNSTAAPPAGAEAPSDGPALRWQITSPDTGGSGSTTPTGTAAGAEIRQTPPTASGIGIPIVPAGAGFVAPASTSLLGPLSPLTLLALRQMLGRISGPTIIFGILFIPTNRGLIAEGPIAGSDGLSYRYDRDMGILQLRQNVGSLGSVVISEGHIGTDGLFRDAEGQIIGRYLFGQRRHHRSGRAARLPDALRLHRRTRCQHAQ